MIKKIIISLILFISFVYSQNLNAQIVYINLDKVMRDSLVGKSLNEYIEKEQKKIKENFQIKEKEIKDKETKIISQKNILKKEEIQIKIEKLRQEVKTYNEEKKKILKDLQKKKIDQTQQIINNLNPILADYMEKNSISLIIRKKDIIIGRNNLNITSNIISLLDKKIVKIEIK